MTLKEWREKEGLTLRAAGEALCLSHVTIHQYERGQHPRLSTIDRICDLTNGAVTRMDWPKEGQ